MSWLLSHFSGSPAETGKEAGCCLPGETDVERQRNQQIEWLRSEVLGVTEVERDGKYRVDATVRGDPLTLEIYLPPRFPFTGPEVKLSRPVAHPWVCQQTVSNCPSLQNFSVHSNLGQVVADIIRELNATTNSTSSHISMSSPHYKPSVGSYMPFMYSSMPQSVPPSQPSSSPSSSPSLSASPRPRRAAPPPPRVVKTYIAPPVPANYPDIKNMSDEELQRYMDDTEGLVLIGKYVENLDGVKKVQADRAVVFQENENQAQINLGHEPELQEGWAQLQEKYFVMLSEKEKYEKLLKEQQKIREKFLDSGKTAASQLKTLAQDAETDSEVMVEDFLENETPVAEFIRNFKETRKLHHLRKIKQEKLMYSRR